MHEVIMCYSGTGEDMHDLKKVGELVRCADCEFNSNEHGNYVNCDIIPQMFGRTTDNYCSLRGRRHDD